MKSLSSPQKEQAAQLIAEGRYEYAEIAERVGVKRMTLHRWRKEERFSARVAEIQAEMNESAMKRAVSRKEYRIGTLADRHSKLLKVIESRALDPDMKAVAGGDTGLMVRQIVASSGELMGHEYAVDTGTLKELRAIEEQVAKELGQIVDKRELTGKDGGPIQHETKARQMTDEELEQRAKEIVIGNS